MDLDTILERVLALSEDNDWEGAVELLRDHLEDFKDEAAVHCWLGVAERELGLEGVAYERFKQALALNPEDPYILSTAGNGLAYFDDADAEPALRAAALMAPQVAVGRLLYGAYLVREGLIEDGLRELNAAREIDADDPQIAYELGVGHALARDWDRSSDALGEAVSLDPEDGWARLVFGLVLLESGQFEEGAGEILSGARIAEEDVDAQLAASLATASVGREGVAYEMLERARTRAAEADLALVTDVEDRLDGGHAAAREMLMEDFAPDLLRTRLNERP